MITYAVCDDASWLQWLLPGMYRCGAVVGRDGKVRPSVTGKSDERWRSATATDPRNDHYQQPATVCLLLLLPMKFKFCSACAVTVVIFRHLNCSFCILTYLLTY